MLRVRPYLRLSLKLYEYQAIGKPIICCAAGQPAARARYSSEQYMAKRFLIVGYYGWKNTGDDAMLYGILSELQRLYPTTRIAVVTVAPIEIPKSKNGKNLVYFVKPSPYTVFWELCKSSTLILGGGSHFEDFGSKRIRPLKNTLRILTLIIFAKLLKKKVCLLGIGISPVSSVLIKWMLKLIFHLADFISVRDKVSLEFLKLLREDRKALLAFDPSALIMPFPYSHPNKETSDITLGISVLPAFKIYYGAEKIDLFLVDCIARELNSWAAENPYLKVLLFVFKGKSKDDDVSLTMQLQKKLYATQRVKFVPYEPNPRKRLQQVSQCDYFIAMRFHSSMFAYLNRIPLLMIDYHPKCRALAEYIGLPKNAIVSPSEILSGKFGMLLKHFREYPNEFLASLPVEIAKQKARLGLNSL